SQSPDAFANGCPPRPSWLWRTGADPRRRVTPAYARLPFAWKPLRALRHARHCPAAGGLEKATRSDLRTPHGVDATSPCKKALISSKTVEAHGKKLACAACPKSSHGCSRPAM